MGFVPFIEKKKAMGYLNAAQRPCCLNCAHVKPSTGSSDAYYPGHCSRGGFGVTSLAVCNEHSPAQKGATA